METLTQEKIIEILKNQILWKWIVNDPEIKLFAGLIFSLHEAEIAKYKELIKLWETLSDMQTDDFEQGTYYNNQIKRQELRKQIETLKSEI